MLMKIGIGFVVVLLALAVLVATRPDSYSVQRSRRIAAPPATVFALVNDFHQWDRWSPWEKLDPDMTKTHGGPPAGTGATYHWAGNSKAGEGHMRIAESVPAERVAIDMQFIKPFESNAATTFTFEPDEGGTRVTWAMGGENTMLGKAFSLVANMDRMIGKDFEEGLANLASIAERGAPKEPPQAM